MHTYSAFRHDLVVWISGNFTTASYRYYDTQLQCVYAYSSSYLFKYIRTSHVHTCINTVIQASVHMTVPLDSSAIIRYTTDGSDPVSTSPVYTGTPVVISAAASYVNVCAWFLLVSVSICFCDFVLFCLFCFVCFVMFVLFCFVCFVLFCFFFGALVCFCLYYGRLRSCWELLCVHTPVVLSASRYVDMCFDFSFFVVD